MKLTAILLLLTVASQVSSYNKESLRALLRELTAEEEAPAAAATPTRKQPNPLFKGYHLYKKMTGGLQPPGAAAPKGESRLGRKSDPAKVAELKKRREEAGQEGRDAFFDYGYGYCDYYEYCDWNYCECCDCYGCWYCY